MAENISPFSLTAPGYWGLNTQDAPVDMDGKFCLEATNCVIDKYGRIGARKGWVKAHTTNADLSTSNITCIGEVVQNEGTRTTVATGGAYLFKHASTTLTTLTYGGGGVAPTISASNWQLVQLGGIGVFFQRGYDPLIFDPVVSTTTFRRLSEKTGYTGTVPLANCALSAYGRLWVADTATDKNTVTWSDTLTTHLWTGGSAGSLNLLGVWPSGGDEVVALAAHNGKLIIFGRKQTLIYTGAATPSTMTLEDSLTNIGCVARDSVQNTGEDIIFLSDSGVRSLTRTIQERSAPLRSLSHNVHNDVQAYITADTMDNVKAGYSPEDAFYVITFPASSITYCFDLRAMLQDGSARTTAWTSINPKCFAYTKARKFYIGKAGYIGTYSGYVDDATSYRFNWYTPWLDLGNPIQDSILKKLIATLVTTGSQSIVFKWGFDFVSAQGSQAITLPVTATAAEYGIAEYGIAEYGGNVSIRISSVNPGGSGRVVQIGLEAQINGGQVSIQKVDIYTKEGIIK